MRPLLTVFLLALSVIPARAQEVKLTSSTLPILIVEPDGRTPDEPKVMADFRVLHRPGQRVRLTDTTALVYDGVAGIELRGATSRTRYDKKSYALETRFPDTSNRNVDLLGLGEGNDWVLHGPFGDKSLLRNALAMHLARAAGQRASATRFAELVLGGRYQGVYLVMPKIDKDWLGAEYVVKIDKRSGAETSGWRSDVRSDGARLRYQYHDPDAEDLAPHERAELRAFIGALEADLADLGADDPLPSEIDARSFADYLLLTELTKNVDGYRLSAYFQVRRDSAGALRFVAGPAWDYNLAFGNADYYDADDTSGWQVDFAQPGDPFKVPFFWPRLFGNRAFRTLASERWRALRAGPYADDALAGWLEEREAELAEAAGRNFARWDVLGEYVWPNAHIGETHAEEVAWLRDWLMARAAWMDANLAR